jgi:hypothetical protein
MTVLITGWGTKFLPGIFGRVSMQKLRETSAKRRGRVRAMAATIKPYEVFTISGNQGNTGGGVFVRYSLPDGKTAHVLDRRVYEEALTRADQQVRRTVNAIRKQSASVEFE